jgi:hypothetical protein
MPPDELTAAGDGVIEIAATPGGVVFATRGFVPACVLRQTKSSFLAARASYLRSRPLMASCSRRASGRPRATRSRRGGLRSRARSPSEPDPHPSDHVEEREKSSRCSTSPQLDFLDAVAFSLGWERAA